MPLLVYKRGPMYWIRGSVRGESMRRSLATRNRDVAAKRAAELELGIDAGLHPMRLAQAAERFIANYSGGTRAHHRQLLATLAAAHSHRPFLHDITSLDLEAFLHRAERSPNTIRQEVSRLRAFWRWALRHRACRDNVAAALTMPRERPAETQPFSPAEMAALDCALTELETVPSLAGSNVAPRTRAMFEIMRCTGLRVSDVIRLRPEHLAAGHLKLRTQKTSTPIRLPLLPAAARALAAIAPLPSGYYFWSGVNFNSACTRVWVTFDRLGKRAKVAHVHPHRFRDTFAVELLTAGADLRLVSKLLGHSSIRTTEKHYAPWVQAFQDQADAAMRLVEARYQAKTAPKPKKKAAR